MSILDQILQDQAIAKIVRRQEGVSIKNGVDRWGNKTVLISFDAASFLPGPVRATENVRVQLAVGMEGDYAGLATVSRKEDMGEDDY